MSFLDALILGIIQGLTEFLPVSSSGHLEMGKAMLGSVPEEGMLMTVILHFATALSTVVIFRKDIVEIFTGLFKFKNNKELRFSIMIILSMIPAALVGVFLEDEIDAFFSGNILLVGAMLILTGGLLFLADRAKATEGKVTPMRAVLIGVSQAIAILPGISRSGATIGTSVLLGVDRSRAARFSFLMVVPLILGAMVVKTKDYLEIRDFENTKIEQRVAFALNESREDMPFLDPENDYFEDAIGAKERAWEDIKQGKGNYRSLEEIESKYKDRLGECGLNGVQVQQVLEHDLTRVRPIQATSFSAIIVGFLAAFITGLFACTWMISIVKKSKLKYFAYYCFVVGGVSIIWSILQ
jgi:undecaprenyl-diphosphatase